MTDVRHTFFDRPATALATMVKVALAGQRIEDTVASARSILSAPAPTFVMTPTGPSRHSSHTHAPGYTTPNASPVFGTMATVMEGASADLGTAESRAMIRKSLPPGHMVHRYRIEKVIGEGGFGITYAAEDSAIRRRVALKEMFLGGACYRTHANEVRASRPDRDDALMRWAQFYFSEEARITFALRHEGIVRIHDFFRSNNTAYIVYEMLDGSDLHQWGASVRKSLAHGDIFDLLRSTCDALDHVHDAGFVHRDLKPANIFVAGARQRPILIDFGAAIEKGASSGEIIVTPGYSPPEQHRANSVQDTRSDIYSLCATFYWLLSGQAPPSALPRLVSDDLRPLSEIVDPPFRFSDRLYRVIGQGLTLDPADRYDDVKRLLDDLAPKTKLAATGYAPQPRGDKIFVSYRRNDSGHFAGRLLDFLEMRFGSGSVFFDAQSIPPGMDFWDHIKDVLGGCAIQLIVMGPDWTRSLQDRRRRWYQFRAADDYVVQEIAAALELQVPILPVLFDGATMPRRRGLPAELRLLPSLNASFVGSPAAFRSAVDGISDHIARLRGDPTKRVESATPTSAATFVAGR